MLNKKSLAIAKWELKEKIRRKSFIVFTILFPALIIALSFLPLALNYQVSDQKTFIIGLITDQNDYFKTISSISKIEKQKNGGSEYIFIKLNVDDFNADIQNFAKNEILLGRIDAVLDHRKTVESDPKLFVSHSLAVNQILIIQKFVTDTELLLSRKINADQIDKLSNSIKVERLNLDSIENNLAQFYQSFSLVVLLTFLTLFTGGTFVRSFLLERSSGMIEIYLSTCTTKELMWGKLLGLVSIGLIQISLWLTVILIFSGNSELIMINESFFIQLVFFILGYILLSAIFLSSSPIVSSEYQAQQLTATLSLIAVLPILLSLSLMQSPNSLLASILAYFPITTAPVNILRLGAESIDMVQILLFIIIELISIYLTILFGSKLFNAIMLLNSGNPKLSSIIKSKG